MTSTFDQFGLSPAILRGVSALGFTTPTPVQEAAIPLLLEGKDAIVQAKTGSGKTLAFGLPLLSMLKSKTKPQALVLLPTRELALQVCESLAALHSPLRVMPIYGGVSLGPQETALRRGVDVVVGTPGRLKDLLQRGSLQLDAVTVLVLDEADEMLNMGFRRDIEHLLGKLPKREQTLIFSATMPPEIEAIARTHLKKPEVVKLVQDDVTPSEISHYFIRVGIDERLPALIQLLESEQPERAIIFTRMKHETKRLAQKLKTQAGIEAGFLNGNMSQNARNTMLERFRNGDFRYLVATDVAARGLDIEGMSHVFHYAVPTVVETYIHRSGRTGRAGNKGKTITFVTPDSDADFKAIQKKVDLSPLPGWQPQPFTPRPASATPASAPQPAKPAPRPRREREPQPANGRQGAKAPARPTGRNENRRELDWRRFRISLPNGHHQTHDSYTTWLVRHAGVSREAIRSVAVGPEHATFEVKTPDVDRMLAKLKSAPQP